MNDEIATKMLEELKRTREALEAMAIMMHRMEPEDAKQKGSPNMFPFLGQSRSAK